MNLCVHFVEELKQLEKGKIMNVQGRDVWVVAGLGVVTADLPQGNDLAGVLRHGASKGCCTCSINKDLHTDLNQDFALLSRYNQITDSELLKLIMNITISRKKQMSSKYGLRIKQSILDELKREKHLQTPQDIYHATAGKIGRLLKITMNLLSLEVALLTKVFEEFVNLPNLHINFHLCLHAHTYATLRNTQVGIKEMVHKIFKSMVPKTNRKVIEKDLLKRYSTIFAIRHLTDGGADKRFSRSHEGFSALKKSACEKLFNDWFVTEDKLFDENDYNDETTTEFGTGCTIRFLNRFHPFFLRFGSIRIHAAKTGLRLKRVQPGAQPSVISKLYSAGPNYEIINHVTPGK
ncbi:unnamed protein product [Rhizophagus irregularis]|nr:unnamed protein product [Rhizophagus irregularis]